VGIAQVTGEVVEEEGYRPLLDFAALLSINLAIINILPLPMLDGGRIVFVLLEVVRRGKRIAPEKEAMVHFIGLTLIIALAIVITYFDVLRVLRGESLFR
jgi:regulator of sigma E protease